MQLSNEYNSNVKNLSLSYHKLLKLSLLNFFSVDEYRPYLEYVRGHNDYINAVIVPVWYYLNLPLIFMTNRTHNEKITLTS